MGEPTAEERHAALVDRLAAVLLEEIGNDVRDWPSRLQDLHRNGSFPSFTERAKAVDMERRRMDAEAILSLLESGDAGVYLVGGGSDLQGTVGSVLAQKRAAEAEADRLRALVRDAADVLDGYFPSDEPSAYAAYLRTEADRRG